MRKITLLLILCLVTTTAQAIEKSYFISKNLSNCNKTYNAGSNGTVTESVDFIYDEVKKELRVEAVFSNENGAKLANGFQFVLNSESSTSYNRYKLPYFYVDASSSAGVKVRAYTSNRYNQYSKEFLDKLPAISEQAFMAQCNNSPGSWDTDAATYSNTEAIFPPVSGQLNPAWVKLAKAVDSVSSGKTLRSISLILDTAVIASFIPNSNILQAVCNSFDCYFGETGFNQYRSTFDFGNFLTIDFIPVVTNSVSYDASGLISAYNVNTCSFCRNVLTATNIAPECQSVQVTPTSVEIGSEVNITFNFQDQDTELNDVFKISYEGVPAGATLSRANNSTFSPGTQKFTAEIKYTAKAEDKGSSFEVTPKLEQLYGANHSFAPIFANCIAKFNVVGGVADPVCEVMPQAEVNRSILKNQKNFLNKLQSAHQQMLGLKAELKMKAPNFSGKIVQLDTEARTVYNLIPDSFNVCSANYSSCESSDYSAYYKVYMDSLLQLYCKSSETSSYCPGIENIGAKVFKRLIELQTVKDVRKGISKAVAKRNASNYVKRQFRSKSANLIKASFDSIFFLNANGLNLKLQRFDYQCD